MDAVQWFNGQGPPEVCLSIIISRGPSSQLYFGEQLNICSLNTTLNLVFVDMLRDVRKMTNLEYLDIPP